MNPLAAIRSSSRVIAPESYASTRQKSLSVRPQPFARQFSTTYCGVVSSNGANSRSRASWMPLRTDVTMKPSSPV
ncbi:hypothetical protein D3C72_2178750 [compost metagenome]